MCLETPPAADSDLPQSAPLGHRILNSGLKAHGPEGTTLTRTTLLTLALSITFFVLIVSVLDATELSCAGLETERYALDGDGLCRSPARALMRSKLCVAGGSTLRSEGMMYRSPIFEMTRWFRTLHVE